MKIKLPLITLIFFLSTPSWSQTSIKAKDLLEKASKKLDKYISFEIEFIYVLNNRIEQINQESKGKVSIAGDKYKLNFLDAIQLFDGKNIYTIVPENEEITLIKPTDDDEGFSYRYWRFTMVDFHASDSYGGVMELELYEASNTNHSEISSHSVVATDIYARTIHHEAPAFFACLIDEIQRLELPK